MKLIEQFDQWTYGCCYTVGMRVPYLIGHRLTTNEGTADYGSITGIYAFIQQDSFFSIHFILVEPPIYLNFENVYLLSIIVNLPMSFRGQFVFRYHRDLSLCLYFTVLYNKCD